MRQIVGYWLLMAIHELTLAFGVGADDDDELTFKTFSCHNGTPFFLGFKQINSVWGLN
jgi:hypothetical protein